MLLIKFGKAEHLEQLKKGIVHFSTIETFQEDPTSHRGDRLDGRLLLEPMVIINGHDYSPYCEEVLLSHETDCPQLSFSASILSKEICHITPKKLYAINEDFIEEMKHFDGYCLIINASSFVRALKTELDKAKCDYEYHKMDYVDKHDFHKMREYFSGLSSERQPSGHLFVKDRTDSYLLQNEWRFVVFDINSQYSTKKDTGVNIKTGFSTPMPVLRTEELATFQCSEDYLLD